ncbi:MAG: transporter substrate-binding domain-containing protein [Bermanella sp.]
MLNTTLIITLFLLSLNVSAYEYRVGIMEYPPHAVLKKGVPEGRVVDYIQAMITSQGHQVHLFSSPIKRALTQLEAGNLDILLPIEASTKGVSTFTKPLFKLVPGLCFKKQNFLPFLSATHRFKGMRIGHTDGIDIAKTLNDSGAKLIPLKGKFALERGMKMLGAARYDAFYHPNPIFLYHKNNPISKTIACSYFHGLSSNTYVAVSPRLSNKNRDFLEGAFNEMMEKESYLNFFNEL